MQYTASQQLAIETIDRNLQIIACAGSGKTQVISARIVEILRHGAAPSSIVDINPNSYGSAHKYAGS